MVSWFPSRPFDAPKHRHLAALQLHLRTYLRAKTRSHHLPKDPASTASLSNKTSKPPKRAIAASRFAHDLAINSMFVAQRQNALIACQLQLS